MSLLPLIGAAKPSYQNVFTATGSLNGVTLTRSNAAYYFSSAGVLTNAGADAPRFDYNPITLAPLGLMIEASRTNQVRNPRAEGSTAGTPGTMPTNWGIVAAPLSSSVVGTGYENGIPYLDLRIFGTAGIGDAVVVYFEPAQTIAVAYQEVWTASVFVKLQAGSMSNVTSWGIRLMEETSVPSVTATQSTEATPTDAALRTQRRQLTWAMPDAAATSLQPGIHVQMASGGAVDLTLRIGAPQLERGKGATSVMLPTPGTPVAKTRSADIAYLSTSAFPFSPSAFSIAVDFQRMASTADASSSAALLAVTNGSALDFLNASSLDSAGSLGASAYVGAIAAAWPAVTTTAVEKLALGISASGAGRLARNGAVLANAVGTAWTPPSPDRINLGADRSGNKNCLWLRRLMVWPRLIPAREMKKRTA